MKREDWIDSCRFLAMFLILVVHFLDAFLPSALLLWEPGPAWWLLGGMRGKLGFTMYFTLLGYFASSPKRASVPAFARYCLRRYVQLCFFAFFATLFFILGAYVSAWTFHTPDPDVFHILSDGPYYNFIYLLHDGFLFDCNYIVSFWCMPHLMLSRVVCRLLGYLPEAMPARRRFLIAAAVMAACLLLNAEFFIWVCVSVSGYLLRLALDFARRHPRLTRPLPLLLLFAFAVGILKIPLPEGPLLFGLEGLVDWILLFVQFHLPPVQRLFSKAPLPWLGRLSMGVFVMHTPIYSLLGSTLFPIFSAHLPRAPGLILLFLLGVSLSFCGAWLLHRAYAALSRRLARETVKA